MTLSPWITRLGQSSENPRLRAALAEVGATSVPTIKKNEISSKVHLKEAQLIFSSAELFPQYADAGDGSSVLSGVLLPIERKWGAYDGDLPYDLARYDSREKLRARFGDPVESDDDFYWDEWKVDDRRLRVEWDESFGRVEMVGVELWR